MREQKRDGGKWEEDIDGQFMCVRLCQRVFGDQVQT